MTDQIRRASRSVCTNIGEAWRKRRYPAHFVSKLSDADAEATETMIWLDFSLRCGDLDATLHAALSAAYDAIGKMLGSMISSPEKFAIHLERLKRDTLFLTFCQQQVTRWLLFFYPLPVALRSAVRCQLPAACWFFSQLPPWPHGYKYAC